MSDESNLISELKELISEWRIKTSDDWFDKLQNAYDDTRLECADELESILKKYGD